eukprot:TRINITY_DN541_c1_g1_i1.p1 TRINITY_DN541_c1_g1~~TRINITY_DN541_c1_g1_i1.p1  ORF type:complete len:351 (-),score=107.12 TRINITY_DN541_c1_g1_i1:132-1184(-)
MLGPPQPPQPPRQPPRQTPQPPPPPLKRSSKTQENLIEKWRKKVFEEDRREWAYKTSEKEVSDEQLLYHFAKINEIELCKYLIKKGTNVNGGKKAVDVRNSALEVSCRQGNIEICKYLLEKGAKINNGEKKYGGCKTTPLFSASEHGHFEICKHLIEKGASLNKGTSSPLFGSISFNHIPICRLLIEKGCDINWGCETYSFYSLVHRTMQINPLYIAAEKGLISIVYLLIDNGACVNSGQFNRSREFFISPLFVAAENGHIAICKYLILKGANINRGAFESPRIQLLARKYPFFSPLLISLNNHHFSLSKILLSFGSYQPPITTPYQHTLFELFSKNPKALAILTCSFIK